MLKHTVYKTINRQALVFNIITLYLRVPLSIDHACVLKPITIKKIINSISEPWQEWFTSWIQNVADPQQNNHIRRDPSKLTELGYRHDFRIRAIIPYLTQTVIATEIAF